MIKVAELRDVPLQGGALKECGNVDFYKSSLPEGGQALEMLDEYYHVLVVNVLTNQHYFALAICFIEIKVKIAMI